jgi:hypothetical protein
VIRFARTRRRRGSDMGLVDMYGNPDGPEEAPPKRGRSGMGWRPASGRKPVDMSYKYELRHEAPLGPKVLSPKSKRRSVHKNRQTESSFLKRKGRARLRWIAAAEERAAKAWRRKKSSLKAVPTLAEAMKGIREVKEK